MIQQIINDAKAMEAETIRSEEDAQKAYEDFVKDTNGSIEAKSKDIVNKSETKAKAEADLVEAKENKEAVMLELEQLANYKAELHSSCDFVIRVALGRFGRYRRRFGISVYGESVKYYLF